MVESPAPARHEWWGMRRDWLDSGHAIRLEKDQPAKAQEFVRRHHRHHPPPRVHSFSLGLFLDNVLIAVLIAAPPIARALDDGRTIEVSCLCTLGHRNAASQLLGHFGRIARDFNYYSLTTTPSRQRRAPACERLAGIPSRSRTGAPGEARADRASRHGGQKAANGAGCGTSASVRQTK
jgi:hypothetical protein